MEFKVEFLVKVTEISILEELFLGFEEFNFVKVTNPELVNLQKSEFTSTYNGTEIILKFYELKSGIVKQELCYEYSKEKFISAKKFENVITEFKLMMAKNKIDFTVISNDLSEYYANRLFPKVQKYELSLRRILIIALLPLEEKDIIYQIKKETKGKLDFSKIKTTEKIEELGISDLHNIIFELNINSVSDIKGYFSNFNEKNEYELKKLVNSYLPINVWDKFFKPYFSSVDKSSINEEEYKNIRRFRNDVMHFHSISYQKYLKKEKLLSSAITELENIEEGMIKDWDFELTRELINDISRTQLIDSFTSMANVISEVVKPSILMTENVAKSLSSLISVVSKIPIPSIDTRVISAISSAASTKGRIPGPNFLIAYSEDDEHDDVLEDLDVED